MRTLLRFITLVFLTAWTWAEQGFNVGIGGVTVNNDSGPFPTVTLGEQSVMLLPSLSYRWNEVSIGTEGLGWHKQWQPNLNSDVTVGYPKSSAAISGERGWLRYGGSVGLNYSDGLVASLEANAAGLSVAVNQGLSERSNQWQEQLSFSAPVWIGKSGSIVLGKVSWQLQNAAFTAHDYEQPSTSVLSKIQQQASIGFFSVWSLSEAFTVLLSMELQLPDDELKQLNQANQRQPFSSFFMLSYSLRSK